ncbi:MAG TPA: OmpA family protein [Bryobacteraceae bacterium]|jgi:peptidoglycan-associated lipoprotein|nr:OmpA family protein [Bryobacteraceae bacterium]
MKHATLALLGLATLLSTAACHKTAPVAAKPADTTPVAQSAPPPQAAPLQQRQAASTPRETPQTPRGAAMTPQERATLNEKLAHLNDALFDYDKATIRDDASTVLKADVGVIRDILANYPNQKLLIEGNADERGSEEYNLALGDRRARAAQEFLVSMGIPAAQLSLVSYGKERPICTDKTEDCWQRNRRAHVTAAP